MAAAVLLAGSPGDPELRVLGAATEATRVKWEKYRWKRMSAEILTGDLCQPGNPAWEPEASLKSAAGIPEVQLGA